MSGNSWGESWGIAGSFAWGDSWGFEGAVVTPPTPTPTPTIIGGVGKAWAAYYKSTQPKLPKKKKRLVDELDEMIAELQSRIEDISPNATALKEGAERALRVSMSLADMNPSKVTLEALRGQIAALHNAIQELDDEDIILLALH